MVEDHLKRFKCEKGNHVCYFTFSQMNNYAHGDSTLNTQPTVLRLLGC